MDLGGDTNSLVLFRNLSFTSSRIRVRAQYDCTATQVIGSWAAEGGKYRHYSGLSGKGSHFSADHLT